MIIKEMVQIRDFDIYKSRFSQYVNSISTTDSFVQEHLDLKAEHTFRVAGNIFEIARNSGLPENEIQLAVILALVHDIGRFQQFVQFGTFDDNLSVNHAELGVRILKETGFLKELDENTRSLIYNAVMQHNLPKLDQGLDKGVLCFSRLIRDADKVDIWYILTIRDVVNKILREQPQDDFYIVPVHILESYRNGINVSFATTMNDHRLLRLAWIYDMNFQATFEMILERGYIEAILAKIPSSKEKDEIAGIIYKYVRKKAGLLKNATLKY
jgi:hypothetical protein